jgi:hypothetical protein
VSDGGGRRYIGRQQGQKRGPQPQPGLELAKSCQPLVGTCFLHTVIDHHS